MARVRPLEVKALVPLLEQDWETPEALAEALIGALDQVRADRTSYVAVMQFGDKSVFYAGLGPYPGARSAKAAVLRHPSAGMAYKIAVVPMTSPEGLKGLLTDIDVRVVA